MLTASELGYYANLFGDDDDDLVMLAELKQKRDLDYQVKLCDRRDARKKALELNQFAYEERQKARKAEEEAKQKEAEEAKKKAEDEAKQKANDGAGQQPTGSTDELMTDLMGSHGSQVQIL